METAIVVRQLKPQEWDALLPQFPFATVFHMLPWLGAIASVHSLELLLMSAWEGERAIALWPLLTLRKGPLRIIGSPLPGWSTPYLGPLFVDGAPVTKALHAMMDSPPVRKHAFFACKVIDPKDEINLEPLGFTGTLRYDTYRLDLTPPESALWDNIRSECRKHIRKATRSGVTTIVEDSPDFLHDYWSMTVETFSKSGTSPTHSQQLLHEIWNRLRPFGQIHAISAIHDQQRIASIITVGDSQVMYNWGSASRQSQRNLCAPSLLQWEAMRLAKQLNKSTYDFISTGGGPGKFKQSFGPTAVDMATHWERSSSRLMRAIKQRYVHFLKWKARRETVNA